MSGLIPWQPVSLTMETVRSAGAGAHLRGFHPRGGLGGMLYAPVRDPSIRPGRLRI
jgi:hypothetical protein